MELKALKISNIDVLIPPKLVDPKALQKHLSDLTEAKRLWWIIDLENISTLDSVLLRVLLAARRPHGDERKELILCNLDEHMIENLETVGFRADFEIAQSRNEAIERLMSRQSRLVLDSLDPLWPESEAGNGESAPEEDPESTAQAALSCLQSSDAELAAAAGGQAPSPLLHQAKRFLTGWTKR